MPILLKFKISKFFKNFRYAPNNSHDFHLIPCFFDQISPLNNVNPHLTKIHVGRGRPIKLLQIRIAFIKRFYTSVKTRIIITCRHNTCTGTAKCGLLASPRLKKFYLLRCRDPIPSLCFLVRLILWVIVRHFRKNYHLPIVFLHDDFPRCVFNQINYFAKSFITNKC